jgi:hypothetical protein
MPGFLLIILITQKFYLNETINKITNLSNGPTSLIIASSIIIIIISIIIGQIVEDLGSNWEFTFCKYRVLEYIDKDIDGVHGKIKKKNENLTAESIFSYGWERFLSISYEADTLNGHRFLRYMLERLKFDLNFGITFLIYIVILISNSLILIATSLYEKIMFQNFYNIELIIKLAFQPAAELIIIFILARYLLIKEAPLSSQTLHECRLLIVVSNDKNWIEELEFYAAEESEQPGKSKIAMGIERLLTLNGLYK